MRICFIGDCGSVHVERWVRWFAGTYDVGVISTGIGNRIPEYTIGRLPTRSKPFSRVLESALEVRRLITRYRPDVVHCHYINEAGWLGAITAFHPLIISAWGSDLYRAPKESRLAHTLNPWALRRADWITCDSHDQARVIHSWKVNPARVSVIGWGIDRAEFHPGLDGTSSRDAYGIPLDAPVLLSPRQWLANSNIPTIIAAHARLADDVYLILKHSPGAGACTDENAVVTRHIAGSPARNRIVEIGELPERELPSLYAAADAVVSLCSTDGTPVSVLEAMAVGQPVVALDIPSLSEWVREPGGRLVSSLDPASVAAAVEPFLVDPAARARAAQANVEIVAQRADRSSEFARMAAIYRQAANSDQARHGD